MIRLRYPDGAIVEATIQRDGIAGEVLVRKDGLPVALITVATSAQAAAWERVWASVYAELAVDEVLTPETLAQLEQRPGLPRSVVVHTIGCDCDCPTVPIPSAALGDVGVTP